MKLNSIIFCLCAGLCSSAMIENAFSMNEDHKLANKLCKLDSYSAMIASKYFTSEADFQNLEMVAKKHRGLNEKFHFNPISISPADLRFWPNLETLHIYNNTDLDVWKKYNGNKRFFRIEVWTNILYEDARNDLEILNNFIDQKKNGNVTFRNVSYAYDFEDELVDVDDESSTLCGTIAENGDFIFNDNVYQGGDQKKSNFVIKEFGELAYNLDNIENINIPNSVTEIRFNSFVGCGFQKINLPDSIKSINMWAFYGCNNLEKIKIPNSVEFLSSSAFDECSSLRKIELPASISSISRDLLPNDICTVTVANWQMGRLLEAQGIPANRIRINPTSPKAQYDWWPIDGNLIVPNECTSIRNIMFIDRIDLLNIKIQNGVQHIGRESFARCSNLLTVMIPDSIVSIGDEAFDQCTNLQYIQINLSQNNLRLDEYLRIYNMLAKSGVDMNRTHVGTNVAFKQLKK